MRVRMKGVGILVLCVMSSNNVTADARADRIMCLVVDTFQYLDLLIVSMSRRSFFVASFPLSSLLCFCFIVLHRFPSIASFHLKVGLHLVSVSQRRHNTV